MKIGLYIPCYNVKGKIEEVLSAVFAQTLLPDEVVVVDDASTDNTAEIAKKYNVKIFLHNQNKGLAAARNTAIKNIKSELIASLDSDCIPEKNWLEEITRNINNENVAGVGGKLKEKDTSNLCDLWRSVHMKQSWDELKKNDPPFLFGSNNIFKRSALIKSGLYDETLRNNYEDVVLCRNIKKLGGRLIYEPKAVAYHLKKDNIHSLFSTYWQWHKVFYEDSDAYKDEKRFLNKIKENIGLANKYLEEDAAQKREELVYLDFLFAIDHCLRDLRFFSFKESFGFEEDLPVSSWLSLVDLSFFYHLNNLKPNISTVINEKQAFLQNFIALCLVLGGSVYHNFRGESFLKSLYGDLYLSIYNASDSAFINKITFLVSRHQDWDGLFEKKQKNLKKCFLDQVYGEIKKWIDSLAYAAPEIVENVRKFSANKH